MAFERIEDHLSAEQRALAERFASGDTLFLEGPAGAGKTTVAVARMRYLLRQGVPASDILVMAPQRTLLHPFQVAMRSPELPPGGVVDMLTIGGLARRMVTLFWPLVAERAGFAQPARPPVFLTLETALYYMDRVTAPFIQEGVFNEVAVPHPRLLSQLLDNLNKAALAGLDHTQVGERLRLAWAGGSVRRAVYDGVQQCVNAFRAFCLAHNLLDYSLQIEVFVKHLLTLPWPSDQGFVGRFLRYRHLIVDNVEEDIPVAHDLLRQWLPECESALLVYDQEGGCRVFLGADPAGGLALREVCRRRAELHASWVTTPHLRRLGYELARSLRQTPTPLEEEGGDLRQALVVSERPLRFYPQMLDWVSDEVARLVHEEGVKPAEVALLAPFVSDALRFALGERLARRQVAMRTHRPSRALRDEPATRCVLTLAALAFPQWGQTPSREQVALALALALTSLDAVRARLLTDILYRPDNGTPVLNPFGTLRPEVAERIGRAVGRQYDALREWLQKAGREGAPLDHFISRLFGEVLSQPGFGFHGDFEAGRIVAQLADSARKFRQVYAQSEGEIDPSAAGLAYVRMAAAGVLAAQYVPAWLEEEQEAVLLTPAYTFVMRNRPVDYQFWLDVGSPGWWQRVNQPLTHPYVLTRHWRHGDQWTDAHEMAAQMQALHRLVQGLIRRCRRKIYLGISALSEQGFEQRGRLLQAVQEALWRQGRPARQMPGRSAAANRSQ